MTAREVADYLEVTERTCFRPVEVKKIPAGKFLVGFRFFKADIDSWIKKQSEENFQGGALET